MSTVPTLLEDLQRLQQAVERAQGPWLAPRVEACTLKTETGWASSAAEVMQRLRSFGGEGWIETTAGLVLVTRGEAAEPAAPVLDAELADGARSLHVRQVNARWRLTWFEETEGATHLARTHTLLGTEPAAARLRYRVYRPADAQAAPTPLARLAGLVQEG
ncbi:hypothetical protein [Caldimonas tepidiphila]|uniref:hypothetical protein n=1 Tax=Caldimonas tepidiphila TaxID=2315841 RepID=UPI000E5A619A|nr:hypothetical protein [Caldimonas tepidiphila]